MCRAWRIEEDEIMTITLSLVLLVIGLICLGLAALKWEKFNFASMGWLGLFFIFLRELIH
jgi:hypothetical protein